MTTPDAIEALIAEMVCSPVAAVQCYGQALAALQAQPDEIARLKAERDGAQAWADLVTRGKSPCGHWSAHAVTQDGGKHITCLQCRAEQAEADVARLSQTMPAELGPILSANEALRQEVARLTALVGQPPSGWQPIATAPKDGTSILVSGPGLNRGPFIARWDDDPEYPDTWAGPNCRVSGLTHWMPLPAPPEGPTR